MPSPIIIPVYSHLDYTGRCLEAIWRNTKQEAYHIVLVDDAGKDPVTAEWIRSLHGYDPDNVPSILIHERNQGYTKAVNTGIRFALEQLHNWSFLVLLNTDTEVQPGWLEAFEETVTMAKGVGVVGAKMLSMDNPDSIIHGGTMDLLGTHKGGLESQGHCDKRSDEVWITFAAVAITKEALLYCGLLDPKYLNFCSDSDFCLTARSKGFRVVYQPKCRILHKQSATVSEAVPMQKLILDQQTLVDRWGGQWLQNILKEMPFGLSRNIKQQ